MPNYFAGREPIVQQLYDTLLKKLNRELGVFTLEYKKTSIHVVTKSAFLGIHCMKSQLALSIVLDHPLNSPRLHKVEQLSKNRWHSEVRLAQLSNIDHELIGWIKAAYDLKR